MITLSGNKVRLRALEPSDLSFLYQLENDERFWEISNTIEPYSKFILKKYLANAHLDIYEAKQLRLVIEENKNIIGLIDLFDYNPKHKRAGLGIIILTKYQKQGYASESLKLLINYCFTHLDLHQLYANITEDNIASIKLFENSGFCKVGVKKDWIFSQSEFKNELLYQKINE